MAACVLFLPARIEMAFWALTGLILVMEYGVNAWGLVLEATVVVRRFECVHVLRSRGLIEERV